MRRLLLILAAGACIASPASAVTIDWVTVGNPGNAADTEVMSCCGAGSIGTSGYGAVAYAYQIARTEVTNAQYTEFLNAMAVSDPNGLYFAAMAFGTVSPAVPTGGISRFGASGSYSYAAEPGRESMPVQSVSFYNSLRFANWLHNGQPTGIQDNSTTEDGAYTITSTGIMNNSITRNTGATIFLPSEDEWYKAAYYDAISTSYLDYPAGTDTQIVCAAPGATANTANCGNVVGNLTNVGSYTGAASPYGTFDQGGNVWEWNEAVIPGGSRGVRGAVFAVTGNFSAASVRERQIPTVPPTATGFRVASIPEPGTGLLLMMGMLGLAAARGRRLN